MTKSFPHTSPVELRSSSLMQALEGGFTLRRKKHLRRRFEEEGMLKPGEPMPEQTETWSFTLSRKKLLRRLEAEGRIQPTGQNPTLTGTPSLSLRSLFHRRKPRLG